MYGNTAKQCLSPKNLELWRMEKKVNIYWKYYLPSD